jgi:hypothetical protein
MRPGRWRGLSLTPVKGVAALRNAPYLSRQTPTGLRAIAGFRTSCDCPVQPASSGPAPQPTQVTQRRGDTRYFIASGCPGARTAANAVRGHLFTGNALHWVLDVVFHGYEKAMGPTIWPSSDTSP